MNIAVGKSRCKNKAGKKLIKKQDREKVDVKPERKNEQNWRTKLHNNRGTKRTG
jgi:hypothetical protein